MLALSHCHIISFQLNFDSFDSSTASPRTGVEFESNFRPILWLTAVYGKGSARRSAAAIRQSAFAETAVSALALHHKRSQTITTAL